MTEDYTNNGRLLFFEAIVLSAIIMLLGWATYQRNFIWKHDLGLWQDIAAKSPNKARPQYNLGVVYQEKEMLKEALWHYNKAISLKYNYTEAYTNLGKIFLLQGLTDKAITYFRLALEFTPNHKIALFNLGVIYLEKGQPDYARMEFEKILSLYPDFVQARQFLDYINKASNSAN